MKINFDTEILDIKGQPVKLTDGEGNLTLGRVCAVALMNIYPDERNRDEGEIRYRRGKLARLLIDKGGEIELKATQIAELKNVIGKSQPPLIVAACWDLLDPDTKE